MDESLKNRALTGKTYHPSDPEARHLSSCDNKLGALIKHLGQIEFSLRKDYFSALVRAIVGQQLSLAAARTIWQRFSIIVGRVEPQNILILKERELRKVGLSERKVAYVRELSAQVLQGEFSFDQLKNLPDEEVMARLTKLKGVGTWTSQMFLIFSLGRPDVLPGEDAGVLRAYSWLYGVGAENVRVRLTASAESWKPFRTIACLYLWEAVNRGAISLPPPHTPRKERSRSRT
ncbi:MAG: DNA-3-methyladenine glycosylase 2 family protein [Thermodesulfobacteriota bacterium]